MSALPARMRALVKTAAAPGMEMIARPVPAIGPEEVLIRIRRTGVCGTDLHIWKWDDWAARTVPVGTIVGHEFAGEIVAVGAEVENLSPGQRCSGEGHLIGHHSRQSRSGRFHLDPETRGIGVNADGAFAEYLRLPAFNVVPLPEFIDDEVGAILDPLGNAVHTALSFDLVGEDVLITGAGPIGIMAAAVARHVGARHIVISDPDAGRLELARGVVPGIEAVDPRAEALAAVIDRLGMAQGFDVGLEMSGAPAAFEQMVESMVMGGRIAMLGIPPGRSSVDWSRIVFRSLTIKGVYGREIFETWYKMIALIENGLDVRGVITHRLPAASFAEAFDAMQAGGAGKVVLDWG